MNKGILRRLVWLVMGAAVCLTASSCRICHDAQPVTDVPLYDRKTEGEMTVQKMKDIIIPEVSFRPPATIVDAIDFFRRASIEYGDPKLPPDQRGLCFLLGFETYELDIPYSLYNPEWHKDLPIVSAMTARNISLYDALKLVCEVTGMFVSFHGIVVRILPWSVKPSLDDDLATHIYRIDFDKAERFFPMSTEDEWKSFFAEFGVCWSKRSSLTLAKTSGRLRVRNSREYFDVLEEVLDEMNCFYPCLFQIEVEVVAFKEDDIAKLQRNGGVTKEALMGLRKAGKSKPVTVASGVTNPEQEVTVKAVREVTYPSEPGSCECAMREVGVILEAVLHDTLPLRPLIDVTLRPQWVTLERWESHSVDVLAEGGKRRTLRSRQPVFGVTSFETEVTLNNGDTVLLGTVPTPDGKWVHAGFLTVRRIDVRKDF